MSEFIEDLVATLKTVRGQTEDKLKSVPAYATYLEIASLTDKTAEALGT